MKLTPMLVDTDATETGKTQWLKRQGRLRLVSGHPVRGSKVRIVRAQFAFGV